MRELVEHPQFVGTVPQKASAQGWLVVAGCFTGVLMGPALVGPPVAGAVRDATGTYVLVLVLFAVALFCAALLVGVIRNEQRAVP